MKFIKPFLLFLMLSICANTSFADDFKDCFRPDSKKTTNECMNESMANAPYVGPLMNTLKTKNSVMVVNYAGNKLANFGEDSQFTITFDETASDYMSKNRDKMIWGGSFAFLFLYTTFACYMIFKGQNAGFIGKDRKDVVYFALTSSGVLILLGFGVLFDLYAGATLTGLVVGISFVVSMCLKLWTYTLVDMGFSTTHANVVAREESTPIIMKMVQQKAEELLFVSKQLNTFNYEVNEKGVRIFKETAYSTCMNQDAEPSRFLATLLLDGYTQKNQKCLKEAGFSMFSLGNVSYFGKDESTRQALLEMNDMAQMVALDAIKLMCGNALNVENHRFDWAPSAKVYDQCLDRIASGGVQNGPDGEIQFFPQNDGITKASIQAQIEQMRQIYIKAAGQFVVNHATEAKEAVKRPLADMASFMLAFSTVNRVAGDLEAQINTEFKTNVQAVFEPVILGTNTMASLAQNSNLDDERIVADTLKTDNVFDINRTISILVLPTNAEAHRQKLKNSMDYTSNALFGNLYITSGFTFEDCTKEINTCVAPVLNQSAALFSNGMSVLQRYWTAYIVFKTGSLTYDQIETPKAKLIARSLGWVANVIAGAIAFLVISLIMQALVSTLFFLGLYAASIFSLVSDFIIMYIKLFKLIIPSAQNRNQERSFHVFLDLILSLIWRMLLPLILLFLFVVNIALEGILIVFVSSATYFLVMPLVKNGGMIETAVGIIFMLMVFSIITIYVKFKLSVSSMNTIKAIQQIFKAESVSDFTRDVQDKYREIERKVSEIHSKLIR